jgi:molecular chaperone DnaJ
MFSCYYKILGLSTRCSREEIKKAFRELALRWHPDRNPQNPGAATRFRKVLEAYETLIHPDRRTAYDLQNGLNASRQARGSAAVDDDQAQEHHEILKEFFGFRVCRKGGHDFIRSDLRFDLQIPEIAAVEGTYESIDYSRLVYCQECSGNGHLARSSASPCPKCRGQGEVEQRCSMRVWVPPGTEHGSRLRVPAGGDQLRPGGPAGDLVILVQLVEQPACAQDRQAFA